MLLRKRGGGRPLLTVTLPVYNVERFLDEAIASLHGQTFHDWEALAVDDGSLDVCGLKLDNHARQEPRLRIIHQRNGGVSAARNRGIENAHGRYLTFLDPDDAVAPDWFATFHAIIQKYQPDFVSLGLRFVPETFTPNFPPAPTIEKAFVLSGRAECALHFWSSKRYLNCSCSDKAWHAETLAHVRARNGIKTGEDSMFCWATFPYVRRLVELDYPGYFYRANPNSILHRPHLYEALRGWHARTLVIREQMRLLRGNPCRLCPLFGFTSYLQSWLLHMLTGRRIPIALHPSPKLAAYVRGNPHLRLWGVWQTAIRFAFLQGFRLALGSALEIMRLHPFRHTLASPHNP